MDGRVDNQALLEAGLQLMKQAGKPLERLPTNSRAMKYSLSNGESVRVRTCNDHILVVLAESASPNAKLNIQGTDFLLIVMPEVPRTPGAVIAYLVPTVVAVEAVRRAHAEWLASGPATKGNNRTWNIWFSDDAAKSGGFAKKWAQYRLSGSVSTRTEGLPDSAVREGRRTSNKLGDVIAAAKKQIAEAAGVPLDAVKISVELA